MLRITTQPRGPSETRLLLEGRLAGDAVAELARVAAECTRAGRRIVLDLVALRFADASGLALLRELVGASAEIQRASAFVSALLGELPR